MYLFCVCLGLELLLHQLLAHILADQSQLFIATFIYVTVYAEIGHLAKITFSRFFFGGFRSIFVGYTFVENLKSIAQSRVEIQPLLFAVSGKAYFVKRQFLSEYVEIEMFPYTRSVTRFNYYTFGSKVMYSSCRLP